MRVALLAVAACLAVLGCTATPPPSLPAGIAELHLHQDGRTLARIAADENATGSLTARREVSADVARQLLSPAPPDAFVPELFDLLAAMAPRMETKAISGAWASYVYTSYERDILAQRPAGLPRRSLP